MVPRAFGLAAAAVLLQGLDLGAQRVRDHLSGGGRLVLVDQRGAGAFVAHPVHQVSQAGRGGRHERVPGMPVLQPSGRCFQVGAHRSLGSQPPGDLDREPLVGRWERFPRRVSE